MALYVDGARKATQQSYLNSPNGYVCAGAGTAWNAYVGAILDEARVSKVARTAAWIKFEYWNLQSADHELTWGDIESPGRAASLFRRTLFRRSGTRTSMAI
jgi:hypothetical protein